MVAISPLGFLFPSVKLTLYRFLFSVIILGTQLRDVTYHLLKQPDCELPEAGLNPKGVGAEVEMRRLGDMEREVP